MADHIVFYGKGGAGKSTLISNVSAALAEAGFGVMQVGCDPKGDSCYSLNDGAPVPTLLDHLRRHGGTVDDSVIHYGFKGIGCIELGHPDTSGGCAARDVGNALDLLHQNGIFDSAAPDYVLYD